MLSAARPESTPCVKHAYISFAPALCNAYESTYSRLQRVFSLGRRYHVVHRNLYKVHQRVAATFRKGRVFLPAIQRTSIIPSVVWD